MALNSLALILAKVSTMGLGFVAWLLAARLFAATEVGIASAAVSAIWLCSQIALLGISSAVIALYPAHRDAPDRLLNTAYGITAGAAVVAGGLFLVVASTAFSELRVISSMPLYIALFLLMSVLGTLGVTLDQTSTALRRGDQALVRGILAGIVTVCVIFILPTAIGASGSLAIFAAWTMGAVASVALGWLQLWRSLAGYRVLPRIDLAIGRRLLAVGLPNYALTLVERAPGPIMPIIVTEMLSPVETAYWYTVWMMAWIVFIIPIQVGINLFAEVSHRPDALAKVVRSGLRLSLGPGVIAATGVGVMAPVALSLLGSAYASAGTTPLRILVVTVLPLTFIQAYFAVCRATHRMHEAVITCSLSGVFGVGAVVTVGMDHGMIGMAITWLVAQTITGVWAAWRLWRWTLSAELQSRFVTDG